MTVSFRQAQPQDAAELARLEALVEPTPWRENDFLDVFKNDWWCEVLADESGQIQAWAVVMTVLGEAELLTIGVRPDCQGRGLGRKMLNRALAVMQNTAAVCCHLEVRASNRVALHLYETSGFEPVGRRKNYYQTKDGREDAVLMRADFGECGC